jgi:hypothetical protein
VPLDRPPRQPAGAVTDRVRQAILLEAQARKLDPRTLLDLHAKAEYLANLADVISDLEERYRMDSGAFVRHVWRRVFGDSQPRREHERAEAVLQRHRDILLELPDAEFLTVIEHGIELAFRRRSIPA